MSRLAATALLTVLASQHAIAQTPVEPYAPLLHQARVRVMEAKLAGDRVATLRIATKLGSVGPVATAIEAAGGAVRVRDDKIGYVRARVPVAAILRLAARGDIEAITVNSTNFNISLDSAPGAGDGTSLLRLDPRTPGPNARTGPMNPFMPVQDVGSPQFIAKHPTYDGRGVTIGIVESVGDPAEPSLQEARGLDGKPVRKLTIDVSRPDLPGVVRGVGADSIGSDAVEVWPRYRVRMYDTVVAIGGRFTYKGTVYRAPRDGVFRIGNQPNVGHWWYERPGPLMLWSPKSGEVWLDSHNSDDFSSSPPIHDFNATGDFGLLGADDPTTPWDERIHFTVLLHPDDRAIDSFIAGYVHTTGVSAVAAGTKVYGSGAHGVAPYARIVWSALETSDAPEETFIRAARRGDVDLMTNQLVVTARLRDGNSVAGIIQRRLWEETKKIFIESMSNDPPLMNITTTLSTSTGMLGVTGYVSRESFFQQFGLQLPDGKIGAISMTAGSVGPASDGGFAPFALTPSSYVTAWAPASQLRDSTLMQIKSINRTLYALPKGYTQGSGTSFASPAAGGVAALLISAARQANIPYDGPRLKIALAEGAVPVPGEPAYRQGNGRLNVERSWDALQRMASQPDPVAITTGAAVRTVLSHELRTPHLGRGLFEREGWNAGDTGTRVIQLTRTSGPAEAQRYTIRWKLNDGTFSSASDVTLPLNQTVRLPVRVAPKTSGAHSAFFDVVDQFGRGVQQVMTTVVAAYSIDAAAKGLAIGAPFLEMGSRFVRVPEGLDSMTLTISLPKPQSIALAIGSPAGLFAQNGTLQHGPTRGYHRDTTHRMTLVHPEPGVWELGFLNANDSLRFEVMQAQVNGTLTVTTYRASGAPVGTIIRLKFAPGDTAVSLPLGLDFTTHVIHASLVRPSTKDADLDLYLARCTGAGATKCSVAGVSTSGGPTKAIAAESVNQHNGTWRVVVDPARVPAGGVEVDLVLRSETGDQQGVRIVGRSSP